jgi:peptidoglycan/xylan/chitin deacetylase (PgdA/CDA1 family)
MVIKLNYNLIAVLLSILFVFSLCVLDETVFTSAEVEAPKKEEVKLPVAMYHHLLEDPTRWNDYVISPKQFEEDLQFIQKQGYETVSAKQILDFVQNNTPLPEKPILITFDDGFQGVYEYAYPLLKKFNMKAVLSIIGKQTDRFSNPDEKQSVTYGHIPWDELREMQQSGVFEIGNHTYNLHGGSNADRFGIKKKFGESLAEYEATIQLDVGGLNLQIENELGEYPIVFAYPYGKISNESKPILHDLGFQILLTCEERVNKLSPNAETPLILKRFNRSSSYSTYSYFKKLGIVE